jgi:hypothetical protein
VSRFGEIDTDSDHAEYHNLSAVVDPAVTDDSATGGYEVGSQWFNTVTKTGFMCVDASVGAAVWKKITGFSPGGGAGDYLASGWLAFNDVIQTGSATYERRSAVIFPGTSVIPSISKINALVRRNGNATSASIRIYDSTNANVIAELTGVTTLDENQISDLGTISNLPSGEAVFEIQLLVVINNPGSRAFCAGIEIRG